MDDFITFRKSAIQNTRGTSVSRNITTLTEQLIEADDRQQAFFSALKKLETGDNPLETMGENPFLDRYVIDTALDTPSLKEDLALFLKNSIPDRPETFHIPYIYAAAELEIPVFEHQHMETLVEACGDDHALKAALMHYFYCVEHIRFDDLLIMCRTKDPSLPLFSHLYRFYQAFFCQKPPSSEGIILFQFMFYGDPGRMGRGTSGGLGTFLLSLADVFSQSDAFAEINTVVLYEVNSSTYPYVPLEQMDEKHRILRIPVELPENSRFGFLQRQHAVQKTIERIACESPLERTVFHIRYLDNASLAAMQAAETLAIPAVQTLTPDPHRTLCNSDGTIRKLPLAQGLDPVNRVYIGDMLVDSAKGILGIGRGILKRELLEYFPALKRNKVKCIREIDEGIQTTQPATDGKELALFYSPDITYHLDPSRKELPGILNVGRLHPLKGQLNLLKGWNSCRLYRRYNLLIVGGDLSSPKGEEEEMLRALTDYIEEHPHLKGKVALPGALPNREVRALETALSLQDRPEKPNLYVCSSVKEEFGISILEAMSAGLVVCAPKRGGASMYMDHEKNGFLVDTSGPDTLGTDLEEISRLLSRDQKVVSKLKHHSRETVVSHFSIEQVAQAFQSFYSTVIEASADDSKSSLPSSPGSS